MICVQRSGAAIAMLLVLMVLACPRRVPPPPVRPGVSAAQLLDQIRKNGRQRRQAVGRVHLAYLGVDGVFDGEADVAVRRPGFLRFELRSFFGQNAAALTVDEQGFVFVDNGKRRVIAGAVDDPALRRVLPLELELADVLALLLGGLPPVPPGQTRYVPPRQKGWLALEHQTGRQTWIIEIEDATDVVRRVRREEGESEHWVELRVDAIEQGLGRPFAMSGQATTDRMRGSLRWRWLEVEINGEPLGAEAWRLSRPPGYSQN